MSQFIICNKDNKGIIAEVVGNMLKIQKRKNDFHPFIMTLSGKDWDANISCTGCGEVHHIESIDGTIKLDDLKLRDKEQDNGEDDKESGPTGPDNTGPDTSNLNGESGPTGASGPSSSGRFTKRPGTYAGPTGSNPGGGASGPTGSA